jgi:GNAT superfamily N-acetyltransferase
MHVSLASTVDRDALIALLSAQLVEHGIDTTMLARAVDGVLADASRGVFFLLRDPEPMGVAYLSHVFSLEHGGRSIWLEELYVKPEHRGRGAGTTLLRTCIEWARCEGLAGIDLEVESDHARVESLYAREGFEPHARRRFVLPLTSAVRGSAR